MNLRHIWRRAWWRSVAEAFRQGHHQEMNRNRH